MNEDKTKNDFYMKSVDYSFQGENPYYNPKDCGLKLIATLDRSEGSYKFDYLCIWEKDKAFYYAFDSGCSCPTPFENYHHLADFTYLGDINYFEKEVYGWYRRHGNHSVTSKKDIKNLISKLRMIQKEWKK